MKIQNTLVRLDFGETLECINTYAKAGEYKKAIAVRCYEITNRYDKFKKYRLAFNRWDVVRVYARAVFRCWLCRLKYGRQL